MLAEVLGLRWPDRRFYPGGRWCLRPHKVCLLANLDRRVTFVGRLRGDAAACTTHACQRRRRPAGSQGGARLPKPKEAAAKADRKRTTTGAWVWQDVEVTVYGCVRSWRAFAYEVVLTVLGYRALQVVVVRDPSGRMRDCYLFTTDRQASLS